MRCRWHCGAIPTAGRAPLTFVSSLRCTPSSDGIGGRKLCCAFVCCRRFAFVSLMCAFSVRRSVLFRCAIHSTSRAPTKRGVRCMWCAEVRKYKGAVRLLLTANASELARSDRRACALTSRGRDFSNRKSTKIHHFRMYRSHPLSPYESCTARFAQAW